MNVDQFRKIIMLAQGEFREFLNADSDKKNEILGRLFDNSAFKRYQELLYGAKTMLEKQRSENTRELSKLIYEGHTLWLKYREQIEQDLSDEDFMALFEQMPEFDDLDDAFVENEEQWTEEIAHYVDEHIDRFAVIK